MSKIIYVKNHLRKFNTNLLLNNKVIPYPKRLFLSKNVQHQKEVIINNAYSFYGTLIDYYLRSQLNYKFVCEKGQERKNIDKYCQGDWKYSSKEVYNSICEDYRGKRIIPWNELNCHYISGMLENISEQFRSPLLTGVKFNEVYSLPFNNGGKEIKYLCGRPDIITNECILDIKTTCNLSNMAEEAYLQILIYYVMNKKLFPKSNIKYIGLVLPLSNEIKLLKVDKWDHTEFSKMVFN